MSALAAQFESLLECIAENDVKKAREILEASQNAPEVVEYQPGPEGTKHPLRLAAKKGFADMVSLLLSHDADVYARDEEKGHAAIHLAVIHNHLEVVKRLIQHEEDNLELETDATSRDPLCTPIQFAAELTDISIMEYLLSNGVDPATQDALGKTPLRRATQKGLPAHVELLLSSGVDVDCPDENGITPLHLAATQGNMQLCELLLRNGADPNKSDLMGDTALHHAVQVQIQRLIFNYNLDTSIERCRLVYLLLIQTDADPLIRNDDNDTALDIIETSLADLFDEIRKHKTLFKQKKITFDYLVEEKEGKASLLEGMGMTPTEVTSLLRAVQGFVEEATKKNHSSPCTLVNTSVIPNKRKFKDVPAQPTGDAKEEGRVKSGSRCPVTGKVSLQKCPITGATSTSPHELPAHHPPIPPGHIPREALQGLNPQAIPSKCPFSANYKPSDNPSDNNNPCAQQ